MAIHALTDKFIKNIKPTGKRQEYCDAILKNFGLRVSKKGTKTFYVRYRYRGVSKRLAIGKYPAYSLADARAKAAETLTQLEKGTLHKSETRTKYKRKDIGSERQI